MGWRESLEADKPLAGEKPFALPLMAPGTGVLPLLLLLLPLLLLLSGVGRLKAPRELVRRCGGGRSGTWRDRRRMLCSELKSRCSACSTGVEESRAAQKRESPA